MEERLKHLEDLYNKIKQSESMGRFDFLYQLLQEERQNFDIESTSYSYHNNLRQTEEKQAQAFIKAKDKYKTPKKIYPFYVEFISNFRKDVGDAIAMLKYYSKSE